MSRFSALVICLALVAFVGACGKPAAPPAPAAPAAPAPAPAPAADAGVPELNFVLVNATGYDIKELYMSPASANSWEENMIPAGEVFANGSSTPITFRGFKPDVALWDLKAVEASGDPHEYRGLKLTEITKLTLNAEDATIE
jgi:hypothetical protein